MRESYIKGKTAVNIFRSVENAIREGRIEENVQLPSVRELAQQLGVNRNTVAAAYAKLREAGLIIGSGRQGSRVAGASSVDAYRAPLPMSARNLASGNVDAALLPDLRPHLSQLELPRAGYELSDDDPNLRQLGIQHFCKDGIPGEALAVVSGAMDGLERALRARLRSGDSVAIEDPGFVSALLLVRSMGLRTIPLAMDSAGVIPTELNAALAAGVKAVILTPRAQNPTGNYLTRERANELSSIMDRHPEVLVIEDDHAGGVAGVPAVTTAPKTADTRTWVVIRSVSKFLGPDLRLAIMAGDSTTMIRLQNQQTLGPRWVSHILQRLVWSVWSSPTTSKIIERAAESYSERRQSLISALAARDIPSMGASGLHVWVPVAREGDVVQGMLARGWAVQAGETFRIKSSPGIRIGIAEMAIIEADAIAEALEECIRPRRMRLM